MSDETPTPEAPKKPVAKPTIVVSPRVLTPPQDGEMMRMITDISELGPKKSKSKTTKEK
jgi:hypothetical protein